MRGGLCVVGILGDVRWVGAWVVVVVWVWILGHGVSDDAVEQLVGNGFCRGGWWRWVEEGYIVVGFMRTGVGSSRELQVGWFFGIDVFVHDCDHGGGADEADGSGGKHIVDCGGVWAEPGGEGTCGGFHDGPVGLVWWGCVENTVGSDD